MAEQKKYIVLDDSCGAKQGQIVFSSNSRSEASDFHDDYESKGNNVAWLKRNPEWKAS